MDTESRLIVESIWQDPEKVAGWLNDLYWRYADQLPKELVWPISPNDVVLAVGIFNFVKMIANDLGTESFRDYTMRGV